LLANALSERGTLLVAPRALPTRPALAHTVIFKCVHWGNGALIQLSLKAVKAGSLTRLAHGALDLEFSVFEHGAGAVFASRFLPPLHAANNLVTAKHASALVVAVRLPRTVGDIAPRPPPPFITYACSTNAFTATAAVGLYSGTTPHVTVQATECRKVICVALEVIISYSIGLPALFHVIVVELGVNTHIPFLGVATAPALPRQANTISRTFNLTASARVAKRNKVPLFLTSRFGRVDFLALRLKTVRYNEGPLFFINFLPWHAIADVIPRARKNRPCSGAQHLAREKLGEGVCIFCGAAGYLTRCSHEIGWAVVAEGLLLAILLVNKVFADLINLKIWVAFSGTVAIDLFEFGAIRFLTPVTFPSIKANALLPLRALSMARARGLLQKCL
jgi:hypothetical protein